MITNEHVLSFNNVEEFFKLHMLLLASLKKVSRFTNTVLYTTLQYRTRRSLTPTRIFS